MHIDVADVVGSLGDGDTITVGSKKLTLTVLRALRSTEAEPHTSPRVKDRHRTGHPPTEDTAETAWRQALAQDERGRYRSPDEPGQILRGVNRETKRRPAAVCQPSV